MKRERGKVVRMGERAKRGRLCVKERERVSMDVSDMTIYIVTNVTNVSIVQLTLTPNHH